MYMILELIVMERGQLCYITTTTEQVVIKCDIFLPARKIFNFIKKMNRTDEEKDNMKNFAAIMWPIWLPILILIGYIIAHIPY